MTTHFFGDSGLSNKYNTKLSAKEEKQYLSWAKENKREKDTYDYDMRGAWKAGFTGDKRGHFPDKYKKPNHPTFSNESMYSNDDMTGGEWDGESFTPSEYNKRIWGKRKKPSEWR
jgi:hypothetical protein